MTYSNFLNHLGQEDEIRKTRRNELASYPRPWRVLSRIELPYLRRGETANYITWGTWMAGFEDGELFVARMWLSADQRSLGDILSRGRYP